MTTRRRVVPTLTEGKREALTCEFLERKKVDPANGLKMEKEKQFPCGDAAGRYECRGELTSLVMSLCDRHADFVRSSYKWTLTDKEKVNVYDK